MKIADIFPKLEVKEYDSNKLGLLLDQPEYNIVTINHFFEAFLRKRLRQDISVDKVLTLVRNIHYYGETHKEEAQILLGQLYKIIVGNIVFINRNYEQFNAIANSFYDTVSKNDILDELLLQLDHLSFAKINSILSTLETEYCWDKMYLFLEMLVLNNASNSLRHSMLLSQLSVAEQKRLLTSALRNSIPENLFITIFDNCCSNCSSDIIEEIKTNKESMFLFALQHGGFYISSLEKSFPFNELLHSVMNLIPETIECLIDKAEKFGRWEYILSLGVNKNKRDLFKIISRSGNKEIVDKFFFLYKNYPEVENLVVFS